MDLEDGIIEREDDSYYENISLIITLKSISNPIIHIEPCENNVELAYELKAIMDIIILRNKN